MTRRRSVWLAIAVLVATVTGVASCGGLEDGPPIPLAKVDMDRMYGGGFLIATIPNWFEKGMVAP